MTQAVAGHGATIAVEQDPSGSPGVFTVIAELNGDITWPELSRPETEVTPHQDNIDSWVTGRLGRALITFGINFIFDDPTHDHLTGLQDKIINNTLFGLQFTGPGATQGSGTDEVVASGFVTAITQTNPVREGARTAEVSVRLTAAQTIDGLTVE